MLATFSAASDENDIETKRTKILTSYCLNKIKEVMILIIGFQINMFQTLQQF